MSETLAPATLLFVDDEPGILSSLRRLFRPHGYRILVAESGALGMMPAFKKITSTLPKLSLANFTIASLSLCWVTSSTW